MKLKLSTLSKIIAIQVMIVSLFSSCGSTNTKISSEIEAQAVMSDPATSAPLPASITSTPNTIQKQTVNDVEFTLSKIYSGQNDNVLADVCYTLPGVGVWDINQATLKYVSGEVSDFGTQETSLKTANSQTETGERCSVLEFSGFPTNADLSSLTLEIRAIGLANPMEGHECEQYNLQKLAHEKELSELGLETNCESSPGQTQLVIVKKPGQMSDEEAQKYLAKYIYGWIDGPWIFTGSVQR